MPTRTINLTPEQNRFIDEMLKSGEYQDASEALSDAVRALQQRRAEDALKIQRLRRLVQEGAHAFEQGAFTDVDDEDLDDYLDDLAAEPAR